MHAVAPGNTKPSALSTPCPPACVSLTTSATHRHILGKQRRPLPAVHRHVCLHSGRAVCIEGVLIQVGPVLQPPPQPAPAARGIHEQRLQEVAGLHVQGVWEGGCGRGRRVWAGCGRRTSSTAPRQSHTHDTLTAMTACSMKRSPSSPSSSSGDSSSAQRSMRGDSVHAGSTTPGGGVSAGAAGDGGGAAGTPPAAAVCGCWMCEWCSCSAAAAAVEAAAGCSCCCSVCMACSGTHAV
jgi:hypothetical protein